MNSVEFSYKKDTQKQIDDDLIALKKVNNELSSGIRSERKDKQFAEEISLLNQKIDRLTPTLIAEHIDQFEAIFDEILDLEDEVPGNKSDLRKELLGCKIKLKNLAQSGISSRVSELTQVANLYHLKQETIHAESAIDKWRKARALFESAKKAYLIHDMSNRHATDILTVSWIMQLFKHAQKHNAISMKLKELRDYFTPAELEEEKDISWQISTRPQSTPLNIPTGSTKPIPQM